MRIRRNRAEGVDQRRIAKHHRPDRRAAPPDGVDCHHVGVAFFDVQQPVGRSGGVVDHHQPADVVNQFGHRPQIGDRAQRPRRRGDGDQPGRLADQALPLPCRQFAGLDVDFGPLHFGAVAMCGAQPRGDVRLVVQAADDDLVPQAGTRGRGFGQRGQQDRAIGAQHDACRVGVEQVGHRRARRLQNGSAALSRRVGTRGAGARPAKRRGHRGRHGVRNQHPGRRIDVHPAVTQRRV